MAQVFFPKGVDVVVLDSDPDTIRDQLDCGFPNRSWSVLGLAS